MEGGGEALPADLRDLAGKVGRRPPAVLLRGLRADTAPALPAPDTFAGLGRDMEPLGHLNPLCSLSPQAYLRAVDVKILQQLVVVNEGIEAVKWLLEERSTLTSRCSSLASSQYSLVESQEASRRGSWDSLQDPNDRLDSISVGSYLDTLADDMDEYSHNAAETDWVRIDPERGLAKQEKDKEEHEWPHVDLSPPGLPQDHRFAKEPQVYDAHWRWLQSQDDVTFL
uniref:Leucine rich adaptor protein 1 n=1 Tax=Catharus ustulatus TaxID=91951 RepID=A0A8C3TU61_CATUS